MGDSEAEEQESFVCGGEEEEEEVMMERCFGEGEGYG
jgi:hypothetical protein